MTKKIKPVTPGLRFRIAPSFDEITTSSPEKSLLKTLKKSGGRNIFGELIKGKLERKKLIEEGSEKGRITNEVLENYGKNYITFKKISEKEYILEF